MYGASRTANGKGPMGEGQLYGARGRSGGGGEENISVGRVCAGVWGNLCEGY